jgi:hypothetical protein
MVSNFTHQITSSCYKEEKMSKSKATDGYWKVASHPLTSIKDTSPPTLESLLLNLTHYLPTTSPTHPPLTTNNQQPTNHSTRMRLLPTLTTLLLTLSTAHALLQDALPRGYKVTNVFPVPEASRWPEVQDNEDNIPWSTPS